MLNYSKSRERNLRENGGRKNERQITTKTTWTGRGDRYAWHGCFPSLLPARILPRSVEPDQPLAIRLFGAESTKNIRTPANPATFLRPSHPSNPPSPPPPLPARFARISAAANIRSIDWPIGHGGHGGVHGDLLLLPQGERVVSADDLLFSSCRHRGSWRTKPSDQRYSIQPRFAVECRKKDRDRDRDRERPEREKEHKYPFKVVEITPPPRCLGVRCFPTVRRLCNPLPLPRPEFWILLCMGHGCIAYAQAWSYHDRYAWIEFAR